MYVITTPRGPMRAVPVAYAGGDSIALVPVDALDLGRLLHCDLPHFASLPTLYGKESDALPSTATNHPCACAKSVGGAL